MFSSGAGTVVLCDESAFLWVVSVRSGRGGCVTHVVLSAGPRSRSALGGFPGGLLFLPSQRSMPQTIVCAALLLTLLSTHNQM